jgi:hypothetical protein
MIDSFDLDALAVSDRFRLFNFTRRDDYLAYLWVLRATDRLRGMHIAQSHSDDVKQALDELAAETDGRAVAGQDRRPAGGSRYGAAQHARSFRC